MRDIASRYSIPFESLEYTREIIIQSTWEDVTTYEDMWYVGKRKWGKLIEDPGVEKPHRIEERATSFGYIFKKKDDKSE